MIVVIMNPDQWGASAGSSATTDWPPTRASRPTPAALAHHAELEGAHRGGAGDGDRGRVGRAPGGGVGRGGAHLRVRSRSSRIAQVRHLGLVHRGRSAGLRPGPDARISPSGPRPRPPRSAARRRAWASTRARCWASSVFLPRDRPLGDPRRSRNLRLDYSSLFGICLPWTFDGGSSFSPRRRCRIASRACPSTGARFPSAGAPSPPWASPRHGCRAVAPSTSCGSCRPTRARCRAATVRPTAAARSRAPRVSPEEVATTFMDVNRKGLAQGLFLTSGVPGRPTRATDRMLATLELLRQREGFAGYIHVKLLPGAETAQVEAAARLATRISVNLEGPTDAHVRTLAKEKDSRAISCRSWSRRAGCIGRRARRAGPASSRQHDHAVRRGRRR